MSDILLIVAIIAFLAGLGIGTWLGVLFLLKWIVPSLQKEERSEVKVLEEMKDILLAQQSQHHTRRTGKAYDVDYGALSQQFQHDETIARMPVVPQMNGEGE